MAVTNFIPSIWEARLLAKFHERSITDLITTAPTKVEGNKIIFMEAALGCMVPRQLPFLAEVIGQLFLGLLQKNQTF